MAVFTVPTYSDGPRVLIEDPTVGGQPLQINDRPSRFLTVYTDADPATVKRGARAAARRRTAAVNLRIRQHR
jgi:hypothetical protein